MLFDFAEARCVLEVLKILERGKSKYSIMFKETGFSHTTLQNVLSDLVKKKFIEKEIEDKLTTEYGITEKGKKLLRILEELEEVLR